MPTGYTTTLGMRGSGSWSSAERPQNYREGVLYLYPNGATQIVALTSKMPSRRTDDPHYHWFTQKMQEKGGALQGSGVYTDSGLGTAYTSGTATAGTVVYPRITLDQSKMVKIGHEVIIRDASDHSNDIVGKVVDVQRTDDTTSYAAVSIYQDDGGGNGSMADADRLIICGSVFAEGSTRPEAISYNPVEWSNYTQIFKTSLMQTRTARKTRLRTGDQYKKAKAEAMEDHALDMEHAFIWGYQSLGTGTNGQPERSTMGIVNMIRTGAPTNVVDFSLSADFSGEAWIDAGEDALDTWISQSFAFGKSQERFVLLGNAALLAIQKVVKASSVYNIHQGEAKYGIKVTVLETPFGIWNLKRYPLFSYEASTTNSMLVLDPEMLSYVYVDDTFFKKDNTERSGGGTGTDGINEEFVTECGLELHHPELHMYVSNVGVDNVV